MFGDFMCHDLSMYVVEVNHRYCSSRISTLPFETGSLTGVSSLLARLPGHISHGYTCLCLHRTRSMRVSVTTAGLCFVCLFVCLFNVGSTHQTQVLVIVLQAFYRQSHLLNP